MPCWEERERCAHRAEPRAARLCPWHLHCEERCYYNGLSNTSSDAQMQTEAAVLSWRSVRLGEVASLSSVVHPLSRLKYVLSLI